jgi:hypothetical protein
MRVPKFIPTWIIAAVPLIGAIVAAYALPSPWDIIIAILCVLSFFPFSLGIWIDFGAIDWWRLLLVSVCLVAMTCFLVWIGTPWCWIILAFGSGYIVGRDEPPRFGKNR